MKLIKIGKADTNDFIIKGDNTVSREHIQIFIDDDANVFVTDLNSMNGTFVNGNKIHDSVKLNSYDIIKIGNTLVNWKEFLLDNVDAQKAYRTIAEDEEIDEDYYNENDSQRKKFSFKNYNKTFLWSGVIICIVVVISFLYFNSDNNVIIDKWKSKTIEELKYTFKEDGTFIKDSSGVVKKGEYKLKDGRKKTLEFVFDNSSLPVFSNIYKTDNHHKFPWPIDPEDGEDDLYGNICVFKNINEKDVNISEIYQEISINMALPIKSKLYISHKLYTSFSTKYRKNKKWEQTKESDWELISDTTTIANEGFIKYKTNSIILKPNEIISVLILTNAQTAQTRQKSYDDEKVIENNDLFTNAPLIITKCCRAQSLYFNAENNNNSLYNNKNTEYCWNGKIKAGVINKTYSYNYNLSSGNLEINGQLFDK